MSQKNFGHIMTITPLKIKNPKPPPPKPRGLGGGGLDVMVVKWRTYS